MYDRLTKGTALVEEAASKEMDESPPF
jgi:hypothetical protein